MVVERRIKKESRREKRDSKLEKKNAHPTQDQMDAKGVEIQRSTHRL
jgi:hypothetical protein